MAGVVLSVYIGGVVYIMEKQFKPLEENNGVGKRIPDKGGMYS